MKKIWMAHQSAPCSLNGIVKNPVPFAWLSCDLDGVQTEKSHDWSWHELFQDEVSRHVSNCGTSNVILIALYMMIPKGDFYSQVTFLMSWKRVRPFMYCYIVMKRRLIVSNHIGRVKLRTKESETELLTQDTSVTVRNNAHRFYRN